ncbi:MAG TPA: long-chain fatty acid--CoA ligase [Anaerolineae bacterium]|nr:long-chain fatty acid--CoA ligase [Anaerolineae bacterium]
MQNKPWYQYYDAHVPHSLDYPGINVHELLEQTALKYPHKPCMIFEGTSISYRTLSRLSNHVAIHLRHIGLQKGQRVGLILPNIPQFLIAYYAILKAGGVVVAINPLFRAPEIERILRETDVRIAIILNQVHSLINQLMQKFELTTIITCRTNNIDRLSASDELESEIPEEGSKQKYAQELEFIELLKKPEKTLEIENQISPDDPAIFQYTGGTTGIPKAAIGLHRNLVANTIQFIRWCDLKEGQEVIIAALPLFHVYGMVLTMNLGVALGACIVLIPNPRDVGSILTAIEDYKATFYPGVPSMYQSINQHPDVKAGKYDLRSIKACISGSATLHPEIKNTFENLTGGKLLEGYGLSEAPTATHCNPLYGENRTGSIGLPLPDVDCRVVDVDSGKIDLNPGKIGELIIKGPQIMRGYHNMPEETKFTLRNGWLYTGDVVRMDKDGYFYIIDRKKSLIKVSGFQVWPNEIEAVIASHPGVEEVGVGGVPDSARGEKVIAWVVLQGQKKLGAKEIIRWCRERLAPYKIPKEIYFIDSLPRSGVGKILRKELIKAYLNQ